MVGLGFNDLKSKVRILSKAKMNQSSYITHCHGQQLLYMNSLIGEKESMKATHLPKIQSSTVSHQLHRSYFAQKVRHNDCVKFG